MAGPNPQLSITAIQSSSRRNALPQFSQRRNLLAVEIIPKHPVPAGFEDPLLTPADYTDLYDESIRDPEAFWGREGKRIDWIHPYTLVKNTDFTMGKVSIKWFEDGVLNASVNCVDRHLPARAEQTAIIFEPDDPEAVARHISYAELSEKVNRFANVLLGQGVTRGDRVVIYMPMIPEAA